MIKLGSYRKLWLFIFAGITLICTIPYHTLSEFRMGKAYAVEINGIGENERYRSERIRIDDGDLKNKAKQLHNVQKEMKEDIVPYYQIPGHEIYLYSAFLDSHNPLFRVIRIFGIQNQKQSSDLKCTIELPNSNVVAKLEKLKASQIYPHWPTNRATYIAYNYGFKVSIELWKKIKALEIKQVNCAIKDDGGVKMPFEIVGEKTTLINDTMVTCVKAVYGNIDPRRFIEWVEFNKILGITNIRIYTDTNKPTKIIKRIFNYYQKEGILTVLKGSIFNALMKVTAKDPTIGTITSQPFLMEQLYLVHINDCLFRYSKLYKYVLLIDIDEFLIPNKDLLLHEMVNDLVSKTQSNVAAYVFQDMIHFDGFGPVSMNLFNSSESNALPGSIKSCSKYAFKNSITNSSMANENCDNLGKLLHTQVYLKRTAILNSQPKSVFISGKFAAGNWHSVTHSHDNHTKNINLNIGTSQFAILHHYRKNCHLTTQTCKALQKNTTIDTTVTRYRKTLLSKTVHVANHLKLI